MTAPQKHSLFTPEPYYIPGYGGFYPQIRYQIGETYGKTTSRLLTDPSVQKSPCSVLAPLEKPRFIEDFSGTKHPSNQMLDQNYSYFPGYTGFIPYQNAQLRICSPMPATESRAPVQVLAKEQQPWVDTDTGDSTQLSEQRTSTPSHPGIRLACGHGWKSSSCPPGPQLPPEQEERKAPYYPDIALACGQQKTRGPCHPDIALACGQGWRSAPCVPGTKQPVRIEGVPLQAVTETVDVSRYNQLPKLDVPNLIQRKAISGYTGFIPHFTWTMGVNYLKGVKDAMNEFDRNQVNYICTHYFSKLTHLSLGVFPLTFGGFCGTLKTNNFNSFERELSRAKSFLPQTNQRKKRKKSKEESF